MLIVVNGQMPGPTITSHPGQTLNIKVINKLHSECKTSNISECFVFDIFEVRVVIDTIPSDQAKQDVIHS